jgi:hypothetical protein
MAVQFARKAPQGASVVNPSEDAVVARVKLIIPNTTQLVPSLEPSILTVAAPVPAVVVPETWKVTGLLTAETFVPDVTVDKRAIS